MAVIDEVLKILEQNRGNAVSGNDIAEFLGVSRAAVWKTIKALEMRGYKVEAVTNKGYTLSIDNDVISEASIKNYLGKSKLFKNVQVFDEIDSTNTYAKKIANEGAESGTVIVANQQSMGRGRMGRNFFSPESGIYMTMLIRPEMSATQALLITSGVAVAVVRAIKNVLDIDAQIKWVNDIYIDGKKVCGILTEASTDFESGNVSYVVVGIGINAVEQNFLDDIKNIATSLSQHTKKKINRSELIAEIIRQTEIICFQFQTGEFMSDYRKYSFVIGKEVYLIGRDKIKVKVIDIADDGSLIVCDENGNKLTINTGEISLRLA